MPKAPTFDTAGLLCRDPELWATAAEVLYGGLKRYPDFPQEIVTMYYPPNGTDYASKLVINFVEKLADLLGGASIKPYSVGSSFAANPPAAAKTKSINRLLDLVYPILTTKEQIRLVRDVSYSCNILRDNTLNYILALL